MILQKCREGSSKIWRNFFICLTLWRLVYLENNKLPCNSPCSHPWPTQRHQTCIWNFWAIMSRWDPWSWKQICFWSEQSSLIDRKFTAINKDRTDSLQRIPSTPVAAGVGIPCLPLANVWFGSSSEQNRNQKMNSSSLNPIIAVSIEYYFIVLRHRLTYFGVPRIWNPALDCIYPSPAPCSTNAELSWQCLASAVRRGKQIQRYGPIQVL